MMARVRTLAVYRNPAIHNSEPDSTARKLGFPFCWTAPFRPHAHSEPRIPGSAAFGRASPTAGSWPYISANARLTWTTRADRDRLLRVCQVQAVAGRGHQRALLVVRTYLAVPHLCGQRNFSTPPITACRPTELLKRVACCRIREHEELSFFTSVSVALVITTPNHIGVGSPWSHQ